jgi:hypothetical protein
MKLILTAAALVAGLPVAAHAAAPATDHSQHQQHQHPSAPKGEARTAPKPSTPPPAHQHGMGEGMHQGMHKGMKMDGCCCCKKEEQQAGQKSCCDKDGAPAPSGQPHDHNH